MTIAKDWRRFVVSLSPLTVGLVFGGVLAVANLVDTAIEPLADDSAPRVLSMALLVLASWVALTFLVARRVASLRQAVMAGVFICVGTLVMFALGNTIRVNLFLDQIQYRDDWRNLMARFRESDYTSLRAFVNHDYLRPMLGTIVVGGAIGALIGAGAGLVEKLTRRPSLTL